MFRLIIVATLIHISSTIAFSEDPYDDEPVLYMETPTSKYRSQKPFHNKDERRSAMDSNFLRFGRSHGDTFMPLRDEIETEYDDIGGEFARPTRSQDKNDNFVRFGRGGNSDFVRFGRDPFRYQREMRGGEQNFVRFGRSVPEENRPKSRVRRDVQDEFKDKRGDRDNFLRFGRGGDDSFIRYGRNLEIAKGNGDETSPKPTKSLPFVRGQSLMRYPFSVDGRFLHSSPLLSILRKLEEEMRQSN